MRYYTTREGVSLDFIWGEWRRGSLALWYVKTKAGWRQAMWRLSSPYDPPLTQDKQGLRELSEAEVFLLLL